MPTLFDLFTDPISLAFFGIFAALWGLETAFPARPLPIAKGHRLRGVLALLAFFLVSSYLPFVIGPWLAPAQLIDLSSLGTWGGAAGATLLYQAFVYGWHRSMHRFDVLFRTLHQMHHSAERLDVPGAFLFSPLDMVGWTVLSTLALTVFGITPEATVAFVLVGALLSTVQHANLRTPRWLGYFIQRPESHSYHHARSVHRDNYADLPVFDVLFGTFKNPADFAPQCGFYDGASARVGEMLVLRDVSKPRAMAVSARQAAHSAPKRAEAPTILSRS